MLSNIQEVHQTVQMIEEAMLQLDREGLDYDNDIPVGGMIEIPAAAITAYTFARQLDFLSIGTNDLTQYLFAIERTHPLLKADELSPAVVSAIETILHKATKPVSICGELAANKDAIPKLLNLGMETLSVSPKSIAQTKEEIRHV